MHRLFREHRGGLYSLGLLLALAGYIPFRQPARAGGLRPAFIRYPLGALIELRYESNPNKALAGGNAPPKLSPFFFERIGQCCKTVKARGFPRPPSAPAPKTETGKRSPPTISSRARRWSCSRFPGRLRPLARPRTCRAITSSRRRLLQTASIASCAFRSTMPSS